MAFFTIFTYNLQYMLQTIDLGKAVLYHLHSLLHQEIDYQWNNHNQTVSVNIETKKKEGVKATILFYSLFNIKGIRYKITPYNPQSLLCMHTDTITYNNRIESTWQQTK